MYAAPRSTAADAAPKAGANTASNVMRETIRMSVNAASATPTLVTRCDMYEATSTSSRRSSESPPPPRPPPPLDSGEPPPGARTGEIAGTAVRVLAVAPIATAEL